jgi:cytochrome c oxidase assembly factor CtaG
MTSMLAGFGVVCLAMLPPRSVDPARPLTVHMVELLAMVFAAGPLLAWPAPLGRGRWSGRSGSLAVAALAGTQWLVHVPPLLHAELGSPPVHGFVQAGLLLVAVAFWSLPAGWPAGASPRVPIVALLVSIPLSDALALWLTATPRPLYSGVSLPDQRAAAAIMFTGSMVLGLGAIAVGWRAVRREHLVQLARERGEPGHA